MRRLLLTAAMLGVMLLPETAGAVSPARTSVGFTLFSTPIQRGHQAKVAIHTKANLSCAIKVVYQGGRYTSSSLGSKRANGSGNTSWSWIVPAGTAPGSWPVTVTCQSGGYGVRTSKSMSLTG